MRGLFAWALAVAMSAEIGGSAPASAQTIPLPELPGNPIARPDSFTILAGVPKILNVLSNDEGVAQTATVAIDQPPTCGEAKPAEPDKRQILFDPKSCPVGTQSRFKYVIRQAAPAYAEVTVTIEAPPSPVPVPDVARTPFGQAIELDVLTNDQHVRPDTVPTVVAGPSCGTVAPMSGKRLRYDPQQCMGEATFEYCLESGPACTRAQVKIAIEVPPPVEVVDDAVETSVGQPVAIDVLRNDRGLPPSNVPLAVEVVAEPTCGSTEVRRDRTIRYDPMTCPPGTVSFRYCVRIASGSCPQATVAVTINAPPAPKIDCNVAQLDVKMIAVSGGRFVHNEAPQGIGDIVAVRDEDMFEVGDFCISAEPMPMSIALQFAQATGTHLWPNDQAPPPLAIFGPEAGTQANAVDFANATRIVSWTGQIVGRQIGLPTLNEVIAAAWRITASREASNENVSASATFLTALRSPARFWTRTPALPQLPNRYWVVGGPLEPAVGDPFVKIAREQEFQGRSMMLFFIMR
jgi:hypothetical protein